MAKTKWLIILILLMVLPLNIQSVQGTEENKITIVRESGSVEGIQWSIEDWYYPEGQEPPQDPGAGSVLNGTIIDINGNGFHVTLDSTVSRKISTEENYTKRSDQIHFSFYGQDGQWHTATLNFRGLWIKINASVESDAVLQDDHGEKLILADFSYSNMSIIETPDFILFNWNLTYLNYVINSTGGAYSGSWINVSIYKAFYLNVSADEVELNIDYYIDINGLKLMNVPSGEIAIQFAHVYICSEYAETNNTERIGNYYSGGIKTSSFKLEDNYTLHYNDSSSEGRSVSSFIINDNTINGIPGLSDFWHFFIWFDPIGENATRIDYDPRIKMFINTPT
ncbi:MAG: hypothetical protein ACTSYB_13025, partial [Candidatus Helarchaeota archaeon]